VACSVNVTLKAVGVGTLLAVCGCHAFRAALAHPRVRRHQQSPVVQFARYESHAGHVGHNVDYLPGDGRNHARALAKCFVVRCSGWGQVSGLLEHVFGVTYSNYVRNVRGRVCYGTVGCGFSALMFDCGEGTMRQLAVTHVVSRGEIDHIFITHMHGDHVYGLPGLLSTLLSRFLSDCATKSHQPLRLYGPRGLSLFLRQHFAGDASSSVESDTVRRFHVTELLNGRQKPSVSSTATSYFGTFGYQLPDVDGKHTLLDTPDFRVVAAPIQHAVPCYGLVDVGVFPSVHAPVHTRYLLAATLYKKKINQALSMQRR
jgi:hypothetical protein